MVDLLPEIHSHWYYKLVSSAADVHSAAGHLQNRCPSNCNTSWFFTDTLSLALKQITLPLEMVFENL